MSKTKKVFHDSREDDEDENGLRMHLEKQSRHHERLLQQALKTKDLGKITAIEAEPEDDDLNLYTSYDGEEEDYSTCMKCNVVIFEEKQIFFNKNEELVCEKCLKKENDQL